MQTCQHIKKLVAMLLLFAVLLSCTTAHASLNITSPKAVLIDARTGQVLFSKNAHAKAYPASTTKIMTAILALERGNLEDYVPISRKASYTEGSRIYLLEGEEVTLEQLLYGLLLESANDAAIAIAEYIGGSVEEFAVMMNDRAKQLGAENTNFTNPHGLTDPNHVTTAYDLALIAKHAMTIPKFREIVSTTRYIMPETNMQDTRYLYSGNKLIKNTRYKYEGANGIKTGYTLAAKQCFVGSASRNGMELISVILNEPNPDKLWENTIKLLDYGFENFEQIPLIEANEVVKQVKVKGSTKKIDVVAEEGFHYDVPKGQKPDIEEKIILDDIKAPVHPGERLGFAEYSIDDKVIGRVRLIASKTDATPTMLSSSFSAERKNTASVPAWPFIVVLAAVSAYTIRKKRRKKGKKFFR